MNVVQVSHVARGIGGGPRRIFHLSRALQQLGVKVTRVAVCTQRPGMIRGDAPVPQRLQRWVLSVPYDLEMRTARAAELDCFFFAAAASAFERVQPSLVWLEHPSLWLIARRALPGLPVVYSAHNVEWRLKRWVLRSRGVFDPLCVQSLRETEEDLARAARFVVCCSPIDHDYFRALNENCMMIANGSDVPAVADMAKALRETRAVSPSLFDQPFVVFVSSDHDPNRRGFRDLVLKPLGEEPPSWPVRIALVGSVSDWFTDAPACYELVRFPAASEDVKNLLILNASAVLLPIEGGGGTNLKSAEALLSGSPVVATNRALRGFEAFGREGRVRIADTGCRFRQAILEQVETARNTVEHALRARPEVTPALNGLTWDGIISASAAELRQRLDTL